MTSIQARYILYSKCEGKSKEEKENAAVLGQLQQGSSAAIKEFEKEQKFTEPPPRYSEASLIKALEENGIGRPSTYATILNTIQERDYVKRNQGKLIPEELGFQVNDFLNDTLPLLFNIGFTAQMEQKLDEVEEGKRQWKDVLQDFYTGFHQPNEIMKYCSQFNDTSLGWFEYVCKHGVLNFVAGYGAIFPLLVPVILLVQLFCKKSFGKMMLVLVKFFFTALMYLVLIVGILYSALFLMEQLPIVAGLLLIIGVAMILPAGQTLLVIVVVDN